MKTRALLCILLAFTLSLAFLVSCGKDKPKQPTVNTFTYSKSETSATTAIHYQTPPMDMTAKMEITVGEQTIEAIRCTEWTKEYNNGMMTFVYTHGSGIYDIFHENHEKSVSDIPELRDTGDAIVIDYPLLHDLIEIKAYRYENGEPIDSEIVFEKDLSKLSAMEKGEWYISLSYESHGAFIQQLSEYEFYRYSYVFKWIVE